MRSTHGAPARRSQALTLPALAPLRAVGRALSKAGIEYALGGSDLLCSLGLVDRVRDWDITTDASMDELLPVFAGIPHQRCGPTGVHADQKLRFGEGPVELIARMALRSEAGICHIPSVPRGRWRGVPVGSPEAWALAYALMGREEKAELLFRHLDQRGCDARLVARLLCEPLPDPSAARLRALRR